MRNNSTQVAYFTALTPFFILGVLLIRGVTLPGAMDGLYYYFVPTWSKLIEFKVNFPSLAFINNVYTVRLIFKCKPGSIVNSIKSK